MTRLAKDISVGNHTIEYLCRREGYETLVGQDVYCSKPDQQCTYRNHERSRNHRYLCMNLSKKDIWIFKLEGN